MSYMPLIRFRVVPGVNSWGLAGWRVESYWPYNDCWVPEPRFYFLRGSARRAAARENDAR